jgi:arylsulfatase A-like enzyme
LIEPGSSSDQPLVGMDFFVTLADLGRRTVPVDRPIDGISIEPLFDGHELPKRQMFWALDSMSESEYAVREGAWKLMLDRNQEPKKLYDLSNDPLEFFNLITDESEKAQHLLTIYNEYIDSI